MEDEIGFEGPQLRPLQAVYTITTGFLICIMTLYDYLKQNYWKFMVPFIIMVEFPLTILLQLIQGTFPFFFDNLWLLLPFYLVDEHIIPSLEAYTPEFVKRLVRPFMNVAGAFMNRAVIAANLAHLGRPDLVPLYIGEELRVSLNQLLRLAFALGAFVSGMNNGRPIRLLLSFYLGLLFGVLVWQLQTQLS